MKLAASVSVCLSVNRYLITLVITERQADRQLRDKRAERRMVDVDAICRVLAGSIIYKCAVAATFS